MCFCACLMFLIPLFSRPQVGLAVGVVAHNVLIFNKRWGKRRSCLGIRELVRPIRNKIEIKSEEGRERWTHAIITQLEIKLVF